MADVAFRTKKNGSGDPVVLIPRWVIVAFLAPVLLMIFTAGGSCAQLHTLTQTVDVLSTRVESIREEARADLRRHEDKPNIHHSTTH